eukprot:Rhum_TRINITY_DN15145_c4_g1::Rhum_TRINITY_DN15145_c4_g1_i1::g.138674::m.138674
MVQQRKEAPQKGMADNTRQNQTKRKKITKNQNTDKERERREKVAVREGDGETPLGGGRGGGWGNILLVTRVGQARPYDDNRVVRVPAAVAVGDHTGHVRPQLLRADVGDERPVLRQKHEQLTLLVGQMTDATDRDRRPPTPLLLAVLHRPRHRPELHLREHLRPRRVLERPLRAAARAGLVGAVAVHQLPHRQPPHAPPRVCAVCLHRRRRRVRVARRAAAVLLAHGRQAVAAGHVVDRRLRLQRRPHLRGREQRRDRRVGAGGVGRRRVGCEERAEVLGGPVGQRVCAEQCLWVHVVHVQGLLEAVVVEALTLRKRLIVGVHRVGPLGLRPLAERGRRRRCLLAGCGDGGGSNDGDGDGEETRRPPHFPPLSLSPVSHSMKYRYC